MVLALWVVLSGAASVTPQANHYRVGVLLSRSTFKLALEGLRGGLATQGYIEEKNITFTVEDAHGDVESLDKRAATLVQARCPVHDHHGADDRSQASHFHNSHRLHDG